MTDYKYPPGYVPMTDEDFDAIDEMIPPSHPDAPRVYERAIEQAVLARIEAQGLAVVPKPTDELLDDLDFLLTIKMSGECCNAALPVETLKRTLKLCRATLEATKESK